MNFVRRALIVKLFLFTVTPTLTLAQLPTGVIEGLVLDQTKALIPNTNVHVTSPETGIVRSALTDQNGYFTVSSLPPGTYDVEVENLHFAPSLQKNILLALGQTLTLTFTLQLAGQRQSLSINASTAEPLDSEQVTRFTGNNVNVLPSNRRDFGDFVTLSPTASLLESKYGTTLTINGQKGIYSSLTIDGSDANNPFYGDRRGGLLAEFTMPLSSVQEFQVVTEGAPAEYGRSTGGFINVVTRSGTNQLHGSGFLFFRDPALASDNTLAVQAQVSSENPRQYQFGGDLGGPIKHDRLFWFLSYEQNKGNVATTNRIDPQLVDIFATRFLDPGEQGTINRTNDADVAFGRIDWMISSGNTLTLRHNFSSADPKNADLDVPTWGRSSNGREYDRTNVPIGQLTTIISPRVINEIRLQYSREDRERLYDGPHLADVTIGGTDPITGEPTSFRFGSPFFLPGAAFDRHYDLTESISINKGSHLIKAGFEFSHISILNPYLGQGRYIFSSIPSFESYLANPNDLSGLLLFSQNVPLGGRTLAQAQTQTITQIEPEGYIQDAWALRPNLKLSYGLRDSAQLEPQPLTPIASRRYAQFIGAPGFPSNGSIPSEKSAWQPRVAVAWRPDSKTVARANIGTYAVNVTALSIFAARVYDGTISGTINSGGGVPPLPPPNLGFLNYSGAPIPNPGVSVFASNFHNPRSLQWSGGFDRTLPYDLKCTFSFNYNNTVHILRVVNRNEPEFIGDYAADGRKLFNGTEPFSKPDGSGIGALSTSESSARSLYRGFIFSLEKPFRRRFGLGLNYTLSWDRSDDDTESDPFLFEYADVTDFKPEYNYSDRDQRHRLNAYTFLNLPYSFIVTTTFQMRSSSPYSILLPYDANEDGNLDDRPFVNGKDIGRNSARYDNQYYSWDIRLKREFVFEHVQMEATADVYNLLNNSNLRGCGTVQPTCQQDSLLFNFDGFIRSNFGTPREAQLGVRLRF